MFMKTRKYLCIAALVVLSISCNSHSNEPDASGVFEATEIIVSSEASGRILSMEVQEGDELELNQLIALIDTTQLYLKLKQLEASVKGVRSRNPNVGVQIAATQQQIETARREKTRMENLVNAGAANPKQLDDVVAQLQTLEKQLAAQRESLQNTSAGIGNDADALAVQMAQIEDQLQRCFLRSPMTGTVLVKYAEPGEYVSVGKPVLKMADTRNMILRVYVTADQLSSISIGQKVNVLAEVGESDSKRYEGTVIWISDKSEFTPKTIQTQDERANLVYAVKVAVKNDGFLKIGMYGGIKIGE